MDSNYNEINVKCAFDAQPVYGLREQLALKGEEDIKSVKDTGEKPRMFSAG